MASIITAEEETWNTDCIFTSRKYYNNSKSEHYGFGKVEPHNRNSIGESHIADVLSLTKVS